MFRIYQAFEAGGRPTFSRWGFSAPDREVADELVTAGLVEWRKEHPSDLRLTRAGYFWASLPVHEGDRVRAAGMALHAQLEALGGSAVRGTLIFEHSWTPEALAQAEDYLWRATLLQRIGTPDGVELRISLPKRINTADLRAEANSVKRLPDPKKVFIIFGRNIKAKNAMRDFVHALGLVARDFDAVSAQMGGNPSLHDVVMRGMTEAQAAIVVVTPDEEVRLSKLLGTNRDLSPRHVARANVIYEAGIAAGIDRDRVVFAVFFGAELFSDVGGRLVVHISEDDASMRKALKTRIEACKCQVSSDGDWLNAGDFKSALGLAKKAVASLSKDAEAKPKVSRKSKPGGAASAERTTKVARKRARLSPVRPRLTGRDAGIALMNWVSQNPEGQFTYDELDSRLNLQSGTAKRTLAEVVKKVPPFMRLNLGETTFHIETPALRR